MRRIRYGSPIVTAIACAGLALGLASCDFAPGKPVTFKSTIDTQFPIPANEDFAIGAYRFNEAFEFHAGTVGAKLTTRVPKAEVGTVPQSLQWSLSWYDPTLTTLHNTYMFTAPLKMRPHGSNFYDVSWNLKPTAFSGFSLGQYDYVQTSVKPIGGDIGTGWKLNVSYAYHVDPLPSGGGNAPVITGVSPWMGTIGSHVELMGTHLGGMAAVVKFHATPAVVNFGDDLSLDCTVPPAATTGPISLTFGGKTVTTSQDFIVQ